MSAISGTDGESAKRAVLSLEKVSKTYGEHNVEALKSVSLDIPEGSFACLMGQSGCGKSTLLNLIAGLDKPGSGRILFDGQDLSGLSDESMTKLRAGKIGFIFQFFNLLSTLTVKENVELPLELNSSISKSARDKLVTETLERVGMGARLNFYPAQLSGGEMQRVAIARAIIHKPRLLVADEPTGNLDSQNGESVLSLLKELNRDQGQTIVMATHSSEAASHCDFVIHMKDGSVVSIERIAARGKTN